MRAFDLNFTRAARIFDPNFMRTWRKPVRPRDKILNVGGILSGLTLNVGKIPSGGGILRDCEISSGSGILNLTSRGGTRRGFSKWVLRELCGETSPLRLRRKFQSAVVAEFVRFEFQSLSQTAQFRKIRAQGQGG